ncbi:energy-coupling factor ABC transporter permease [Alkalimarinus coralli]|uniref:energy-coupling factor ABC transporter permease n=1 Tax=Alkalimarinus coralli TaxID=2935863 RepID=UPI00202B3576|nr:energy-coupling factor ABC transporter permease [Alkalimarinus coralli]
MHIEPGVVEGTKIALSYGTALLAVGVLAKVSYESIRQGGLKQLLVKSLLATLSVFVFFEVLPHHPVGVSEVHLILGSTLLLILGVAPAAIGLAAGLLIQGIFMAPFDLPQYGMNVTTLLVPLYGMNMVARKIIPANVAYKDITYSQTLRLSLTYQGGIIAWVAFWALYGGGFSAENLNAVATFSLAYTSVIVLEPLVDLAVLAIAKAVGPLQSSRFFEKRLFEKAA